ncbi:MAG TPA: glycine cleavage system protein GcvH [Candidatus Kapabacteria bacterium]|jgi:glycine cleavage system H protein|nr:glycine cleavage system protein GcvH [Candidatus Kapabacteria bacterium]
MNFPQDLKYAKSHEWLRVDSNAAYVGISDYAQSELGDIVFVDITAGIGEELTKGSVFGTIEAVKTVSDLYMPIDGKIIEVNQTIIDTPETINKDPYGEGWLIKIEPAGEPSADMMDSATYQSTTGH